MKRNSPGLKEDLEDKMNSKHLSCLFSFGPVLLQFIVKYASPTGPKEYASWCQLLWGNVH